MSRSARGRRRSVRILAALVTAGAMLPLAAASAGAATTGTSSPGTSAAGSAQGGVAPGAPGSMSYFDLARKDCVGTATGTASKVWYTVAGGVLSDTYEPTIDNTNVSTLQYVVTNGSTFTDLQTRDMSYTVSADPTGMACTVTATDAQHGYRLTTTYITDPGSDTVLMHTRLSAVPGSGTNVAGLHLYARLDAHVNGNGGGGSDNAGANNGVVTTSGGSAIPVVSSTNTVTDATNRTYAVPTYMALADSTPAPQASVGYAGTASDGLTQLDTSHALTPYSSAPDGHIVATQELAPGPGGTLTLALGFGRTQAGAVSTARGSLATPFALKELKYLAGWVAYDASLNRPPARYPGEPASATARLVAALLPVRERAQGERGQDLPRRHRGLAGQPVGPGGAGRDRLRRRARLLRFLPRGVLPRPVRGVHRPAGRRRPGHGAGGGPVPVRPPATAGRGHAAQLAAQRQGRPRHRRTPAGRGRLPDPDGLPGRPERGRHTVGRPRPAGGRLPGRPRSLGRERTVGGADRLLALHHRGRDRRADRGVRHRRRPRRPGPGPALPGDGRLLPAQHQVLGRDHDRAGRAALLHPAVEDR